VGTSSQEDTAFIGLYEYCVMPFGIRNAPSVFQQSLLLELKSDTEKEFVEVHDIIIYSNTSLNDHLIHLQSLWVFEGGKLNTKMQICTLLKS